MNRISILPVVLGAAGCVAPPPPLPPPQPPPGLVAIEHVTVLPGPAGRVVEDATVLIEGATILAVTAGGIDLPAGARRVDGTGRYVIPGLIEAHAHVSKARASSLGLFVANGVTTVRDMGGDHRELLEWRRRIREGAWVGPRLVLAGPYLESARNIERMRADPPEARIEPFERTRIGIGSPDAARRVVDSLAALDVDFLKIRTVEDRETYRAIAAGANRHGVPLVGHVLGLPLELVLEARQAGIEHFIYPTLDSLSEAARRDLWRRLAEQDVHVTPTLVTFREATFRSIEHLRRTVQDTTGSVEPRRRYVSRYLVRDWREQLLELDEDRQRILRALYPSTIRNFREMHEAGVTLLPGSDVAVLNVFPGSSLHEEMELFVTELGLTPVEVLERATLRAARFLGIADSVGTVAPGKVADLVLLDGDPRQDIRNTRRIAGVALRGRWLDARELDALLEDILAAPDLHTLDWGR